MEKGQLILGSEVLRNGPVYRGIMELLARFGYLSIQEVKYGFDLTIQTAINRLFYLKRSGYIQTFKSQTLPPEFYCLTRQGREVVQAFTVSNWINHFVPSQYNVIFQEHTRSVIKTNLALRKILGADYKDWVGEDLLKQNVAYEASQYYWKKKNRVLDGELYLQIHKTRYKRTEAGDLEATGEVSRETWKCGIEVELSSKSLKRYRQQFEVLRRQVYEPFAEEQLYPMMIFLCGSQTIRDNLLKAYQDFSKEFGNCIFYFGLVDEVLQKLKEAPLLKVISGESQVVKAGELNHVSVRIAEAAKVA